MNIVQQAVLDLVKARLEIGAEPTKERRRELILQFGEQELTDPLLTSEPEHLQDIMNNLAFHISPVWDEEHKGVYIPLIGKTLFANKLSPDEVEWDEAMKLAEVAGVELPRIDDLRTMFLQKDAINAILIAHGGDPLEDWCWSSDLEDDRWPWVIYFGSGNCISSDKYFSFVSRAVVAFK